MLNSSVLTKHYLGFLNFLNKNRATLYGLGIIILLLLVSPYIIISIFNQPMTDDYCFMYRSSQLDFWTNWTTWYVNWTGRYFSTAAIIIGTSIIKAKIIPIIIIILSLWAFYFFIRKLFSLTQKESLISALFLLFFYLSYLPSPTEGIYWLAGILTYQLAGVMIIFFLGWLNLDSRWSPVKIISLALLLIAIIRSNELALVFMSVLLGALFLYSIAKKKLAQKYIGILFGLALIFSVIVILAPGNDARASYLTLTNNLAWSIGRTWDLLVLLDNKFLSVVLILASLLFAVARHKKIAVSKIKEKFGIEFWWLVLFLLIAFFSMLVAFYYKAGKYTFEGRMEDFSYLVFIAIWLLFVKRIREYFADHQDVLNLISKFKILIIILALVYASKSLNNWTKVYHDLTSGRAAAYNQMMNNRHDQSRNNPGQDLQFKKMDGEYPISLFGKYTEPDSPNWSDSCYSSYFNLKSINIK